MEHFFDHLKSPIVMNITPDQEKLLNSPLPNLDLSENFIYRSQCMGFTCLKQMTDMGWTALTQHEGFSNMWFSELLTLLKKEGMLSLLYQREPGTSD